MSTKLVADRTDANLAALADWVFRALHKGGAERSKLSVAFARISGSRVRVSYRGGEGNAAGYVFADLGDMGVDAEFVPSAPEASHEADITIGIPAESLDDAHAHAELARVLTAILPAVP